MRARGISWWVAVACVCLPAAIAPTLAATKSVDLDAEPVNGAESRCDINVLQTFPVKIESVIFNRAVGDAFTFNWPSAGPGGFSSSTAPGTTSGVGAKWVWTTNQTVYAFTGSSCANDVCFLHTAGPDPLPSACTQGCADDGVQLTVARGVSGGDIALSWVGGTPAYRVYRSTTAASITAAASLLLETSVQTHADVPPPGGIFFYRVRGASCLTPKSCDSASDCIAGEGVCVSRGPFAVPGRSLIPTDVTVSSASLTSSLVTFFSPPTELFRITSTAQPGGFQESLVNGSTTPMTVVTEASPPGCCPFDPEVPHQLNCDGTCVDFLNDPLNCGACGNVCGDGTCCSGGSCVSLCEPGQIWCDGACRDPQSDNDHCGACGNVCGDGNCCVDGACAPFVCEEGSTLCGGECVDVQNDNENCGSCGNVCGPGSCCTDGACVSTCEEGRTVCGELCYDLQNDPDNCGACGNVCAFDSICAGGECIPCTGQGGARDVCDNRCVNLRTDPYNCGECGQSCNIDCPSNFKGVCSNGESCGCVPGTPAPPLPPNTPQPTPQFCPNTNPPPDRTDPFCGNPSPTGPVPGVCPGPGLPPDVEEAPVCSIEASEVTIPAGEASTICRPGGVLFKEVPSVVRVCGDGIPGEDGECFGGISPVTTGTFMRLIPDTETEIGDAFVTPYAIHVLADDSNDGLIQPGESATLVIDVVNAGPLAIAEAAASLTAAPVDLTDDGVDNPLTVGVLQGSSSYGTLPGTPAAEVCQPVALQPGSNLVGFRIAVPPDHPGDTSTPLALQFTGSVDGSPFSMGVPFTVGIADRCVPGTGGYDGLQGLLSPMARMVPVGDPLVTPLPRLNPGSTGPLKLQASCAGVNLGQGQMDPPEIVGVSEAVRGPLNIQDLDLNDSANPDDPLFRWNASAATWIFNMRTENLGTGTFTLTIRIAGRKDYVTGFEVR